MTKSENTVFWTVSEAGEVNNPGLGAISPERFLSGQELQRLETMQFPKRRFEWLHGRFTTKHLLRRCTPAGWQFSYTDVTIANEDSGKPFAEIDGHPLPCCLSISHREGFAAAAVIWNATAQIGIDLEIIEPRSQAFISDYFTAEETSCLSLQPQAGQDMGACLIWSAKEAALKALGLGLRVDTRQVEISFGNLPGDTRDWETFAIQSPLLGTKECRGWWQKMGKAVLTIAMMPAPGQGNISLEDVSIPEFRQKRKQ